MRSRPLTTTSLARKQRLAAAKLVRCRSDLRRFFSFANGWPVPDHQAELCRVLQHVEATPDARVIVTMPPRHGKSEVGSVTFPAWCLGRGQAGLGPIERVAIAAYGHALATTFTAAIRDAFLDESGPVRRVFPTTELATTAEHEWHFTGQPANRPNCIAVGIGGPFTGRGADLLVVDDPVKTAEEARSELQREKVWRWWKQVARTRLQPGGRVVVIMTRWHDDDLAGRFMEQGGWDLLHLPAIDDAGNALWPDAYPIEALEAIRSDLGEQEFEALYQSNPTPLSGDVWHFDWFADAEYAVASPCFVTVTAWDTAYETSKSADYTAWVRMGLDESGHFWVLGAGHRRMEFPDLERAVADGFGAPPDEPAVIEKAASGRSAIQTLRAGGRPIIPIKVELDKRARAAAVTGLAQGGRVHLPLSEPWAQQLMVELMAFPNGRHDDLHDAFVHALAYLRTKLPQRDARSLSGPAVRRAW